MPEPTAADPRITLAARALRDGPYVFLPSALRHLSVSPNDHDIRLHAFKHLLAIGLVGPAVELIEERPDLLDVYPDVAEILTQVASLPHGRLDWRAFGDRFESNLAALGERHPDLAHRRSAMEAALTEIDLYQCTDGNYQLSTRPRTLPRRWLPQLIDNRGAFDPKAVEPSADAMFVAPYLIVHVRFGELFGCVYRATQEMFLNYRPGIHVIESNLAALAVWLHLADLADMLRDERVRIWAGPEATRRFYDHFEQDGRRMPPTTVIHQPTWSLEPLPVDVLNAVTTLRERQTATGRRATKRIYASRDPAWWAERYASAGPDDPLRILGVTSRATTVLQYSMRDIAHACEQLGHRFRLLIEPDDHGLMPASHIVQSIAEFKPDLFFALDHLRYESPGMIPDNLPHCCWVQDYMPNLLCPEAGASIGPLDFVCGYWVDRCVNKFGYPANRFLNTNIPVSTRLFHDAEIDEDDRARYACDISVMSNASTPIEAFYATVLDAFPAEFRPLITWLHERADEIIARGENFSYHHHTGPLVRDGVSACGLDCTDAQIEEVRTGFLCRRIDWGRRQQTLEWVADWARRTGRVFKLYGRGWDTHPTLSAFAAGFVEHGEPMRRALRASKLALQVTTGFSHQRSFECLAGGTLPLARYCYEDFFGEPLETYVRRRDAGAHPTASPGGSPGEFDCAAVVFPGLERVVFHSAETFEALAERYLGDEKYRAEVTAELREVVLAEYTYEAVMRRVLGMCRDRLTEPGHARVAPSPVLVG